MLKYLRHRSVSSAPLWSIISLSLFLPALLDAQVVLTLAASRDTTIYEPLAPDSAPGDSSLWPANGAGDHLFAGRTASGNQGLARRAIVSFDLSTVPAGVEILSVELVLYLSQTITTPVLTVDVSLHRAQAAWSTGSSNAPGQEGGGASATTGDATWRHTAFPTTSWDQFGGDFAVTASAVAAVGDRNRFYSWTGPGLVADVTAWLADPSQNFGWFVIGDESTVATAKRFDSAERFEFDALTNRRTSPQLLITYAIPEPTTAALALVGTVAILAHRRRRRR